MSSPDIKNDAAPKWASNSQRVFLMRQAIHALTGRAARHENTEIYFLWQHFPKNSSLGMFATKEQHHSELNENYAIYSLIIFFVYFLFVQFGHSSLHNPVFVCNCLGSNSNWITSRIRL